VLKLNKKTLVTFAIMLIIAIFGGVLLSNYTESLASRVAVQLMQLVSHGSVTPHKVDKNGIPRVRYPNLDKEFFYNPVYIGIYGLYYHDMWLDNGENKYFLKYYSYYSLFPPKVDENETWFDFFLSTATWFVENQKLKKWHGMTYGIYEYPFRWDIYKLEPPWASGMAQGLAIQILLRAWLVTHDQRYIKSAFFARNAFFVPVQEGGVTYKDSPDSWWFEEYAAPGARESRVLNGM